MGALPVARSRPAGRDAARAVAASVPRSPRAMLVAVTSLLVVGLLLVPIGAVAQIVLTAQLDDRTTTQAIVVLDTARAWGDPRELFDARLDHAAALYRDGVAPVVIVTGPPKSGEHAMSRLVGAGLPMHDVVTLDTGADTVGSLQVVATVLRDLGWDSVTVVADPAHAARVAATAEGFGIDAHVSPTDAGGSLTSDAVARETAALLRYYVITRPGQPTIIEE